MKKISILISLVLTGCFSNSSYLSTEEIHASDWTAPPGIYKPKPLFCYKSLGKPHCYDHPVQELNNQLIAVYNNK